VTGLNGLAHVVEFAAGKSRPIEPNWQGQRGELTLATATIQSRMVRVVTAARQ
jgi:hypothetical protein